MKFEDTIFASDLIPILAKWNIPVFSFIVISPSGDITSGTIDQIKIPESKKVECEKEMIKVFKKVFKPTDLRSTIWDYGGGDN